MYGSKMKTSLNRFASAKLEAPESIPLRVKSELRPEMLALLKYKSSTTEDLIERAFGYRNVHTADRASAIAVLRGVK